MKITEETKQNLCTVYTKFFEENFGQYGDLINKKFFAVVQHDFEELTEGQMRGILVSRKVYHSVNPRQPPKKGGKRKSDYLAELVEVLGVELESANKMTIADIETLIEVLR